MRALRNSVVSFGLILVAGNSVKAADIWLGPMGNMTSTTISGYDDDQKTAFGGGVQVELGLTDRLSIVAQPGLVTRKTSGYVAATSHEVCVCFGDLCFCSEGGSAGYDFDRSFSHLDTAALVKCKVLKKGVTPYFLAGPSVGIPVSAKYKRSTSSSSTDVKDDTAVDFGLVGGAGVEIPIGARAKVFVEGQYGLGLTGIWKDDDDPNKFRTILVKAGVEFSLKKKS